MLPFNIKGLLQDEEFLFAAGLLQQGSQGKSLGQAAFPALIQAGKLQKAFAPKERRIIKDAAGFQRYGDSGKRVFPDVEKAQKFNKTKQAFDNVLGKNVFVTDAEIAGMPNRFTPIDKSQNISFNTETGEVNIGSTSGAKTRERNQINDNRAAKMLQGTYGYLKDFIPKMQESAAKTPSGAVGGTFAFIDSVSDQFNQLGEFTGIKNSKISFGSTTDKFLQSKGFDRDVANYAKLKGSVTKLGYSLAKIEEPDNPRLSEGDVLRQLDRINFGGSRNQFVNSLQGILEDEFIAGKAKFNMLNPKGEWGYEDPRKKSTGSNIGAGTTNQGLDEDILGYFK